MKNTTSLHKVNIKIGDLFKLLNLDNDKYEDVQTSTSKVYIKNLQGDLTPILGYVKKNVNLIKYTLESKNGYNYNLTCSDHHLVLDENENTRLISDTKYVQSLYDGILSIVGAESLGQGDAYDIAIDDPHLYYTTNGIIHHNTTISRILTQGYDTLYLNGSSENGIETVRNQIVAFSSQISLEDGAEKMKIVYIDECDGFSEAAWSAMRETIEHYASSVRFIMTCNKFEKIPSFIQSRFNCIPVYPINIKEQEQLLNTYCEYIGKILTALKIGYTNEVLVEFVKNSFPDMRSILNTIQSLYLQGAKELDRESLIKTFDCSDLFELMISGNDPVENYKFIMTNYSSSPDEAMMAISQSFVEFVRVNYPQYNSKIPYIIIAIAEYMAQLNISPDRVIVLLACCFKIQTILKS